MSRLILLLLTFCYAPSLWSYDVVFEGIESDETMQLLQSASKLEKLKDSPPATKLGLKLRAEDDRDHLIQVLQSQGYYGAKVCVMIEDNGNQK